MKDNPTAEPSPRARIKSHLTRGSVLYYLGFSPSEVVEIKVRAEIYRDLLQHIRERRLPQQELAAVFGIHQSDVSHLLNGNVSNFSVSKLILSPESSISARR